MLLCLFFKQETAYEMRISDWSLDVCSSYLSGGALTLESVVGIGTVASIWLPEAEAAKQAVKVHERNVGELKTTNRLRVLVVDDQDLVSKSLADMLSVLGHDVMGASTGAQALQILGRNTAFSMLCPDK